MDETDTGSDSQLVVTRDGSHTVYSSRFDQHYHNPNGAVAESRYVFFEQTDLIEELDKREQLTILEVGFGTGLSLMLLLDYYRDRNSSTDINYYSIEGYPLSAGSAKQLNYDEHLRHPGVTEKVTDFFESLEKGMNHYEPVDGISVHLFFGMFDDFPEESIAANYVFHDAFSPDVNPDLWTGEVFKKIAKLSADDVILSTYCAASAAKGAMAWAGWQLARAQGALGKREMTLAALDAERLGDRKSVNGERLAERYEAGDFD